MPRVFPPLVANAKWIAAAALVVVAVSTAALVWMQRQLGHVMAILPPGGAREVSSTLLAGVSLVALAAVFTTVLVLLLAQRRPTASALALRNAAERMAQGDFAVRLHPAGDDALSEAERAIDRLAGSLESTLADLHQERAVQGQILEEMHEGVLVLDRDGRVVMMNPAFRSMLLLGTEAKGRLLIEVVRHAELHEIVSRARAGKTTALGEIDLPGIKPRRLLTHATAFAGEAGGLLAVFVDVTDLRRLESLRRDFVANVSHELRTPVTAMRSAAETLRVSSLCDGELPVALRFVDIIERNGERLQSLIEDLMDLSRLESKEFRLKREEVELGVVASIVIGLFRERADKKDVKIRVSIDEGTPTIVTDQRALEQVIGNLIDNAIKYCPSGSFVALGMHKMASGVRVVVSDNGPGIDPAHLPRVFERFYRVDAGRSRDVGGTGLGLSIVKHLVEAMGGQVTVESDVGKGATFTVSLPAKLPAGSAR
jgi:two-component system phosphate regulon sensor histidine kinase PhoR